MNKTYKTGFRIWVDGESATFLGEGRVRLLEEIAVTGSINVASRNMGMSYKKALKLLETMNSQGNEPLVVSNTGGKGGGGSVVTPAGRKAIQLYRDLSEKCSVFLENELQKMMDQ